LNKLLIVVLVLLISGCVVVPETVPSDGYQCGMSSDKKVLKIKNLTDGDTSFYEWNDEFLAVISIPTSAIISGTYVLVNNIYHVGEKIIKCG
jgi:uncharacterized protein YceK